MKPSLRPLKMGKRTYATEYYTEPKSNCCRPQKKIFIYKYLEETSLLFYYCKTKITKITLNNNNPMASTSETGHDLDITNAQTVLTIIQEHSATYQPPVPELELAALTPQVAAAAAAQKAVNDARRAWAPATNNRENLYAGLGALSTKVWGTVKLLRIADNDKALVESIHKKLQGKWAVQKPVDENKDEAPKARSGSQMSYESQAKNLEDLIGTLKNMPEYTPREDDRKIATLEALLVQINTLNASLPALEEKLRTARDARNKLYYTPKTGLIDTIKDVKAYFHNLGTRGKHPGYVAISKLQFTKAPAEKNKAAEQRKKEAKKKKDGSEG